MRSYASIAPAPVNIDALFLEVRGDFFDQVFLASEAYDLFDHFCVFENEEGGPLSA